MKRPWIGVLVLGLLIGGVVVAKSMRSEPAPPAASSRTTAGAQGQPQVLLFADPKEAEESCGCGEIFRAVQASSTRGVRTQVVDPERERDLVRQYRVRVAPTVIFADETGREVSRHEGESSETIAALQADLDRLAGGRP